MKSRQPSIGNGANSNETCVSKDEDIIALHLCEEFFLLLKRREFA